MKYRVLSLIIFLLFISRTGSPQWLLSYKDTTERYLNIQFSSANTGWATGYKILSSLIAEGKVLKTSNAGINWALCYNGQQGGLWGIYFVNDNTGWAAGDKGLILKTTNGGMNWTKTITSTGDYHNNVYFINQSTGWIAGTKLYKTTDAGSSWVQVNAPVTDLFSLYFFNENTGFVTGYYSRIFRTTNAGAVWEQVYAGQYHTFIYDICFVNSSTGFGAGDSDYDGILKTTNGGVNWTKIYTDTEMMSVFFKDELFGFAGGRSKIVMTSNSGQNWTAEYMPVFNSGLIRRVARSNDSTYWAAGDGGYIFKKTVTQTGIVQTGSGIPEGFSLQQNYPNPFNANTVVRFSLLVDSDVLLKVYDVMGREVLTLVNERLGAGTYEVRFDGSGLTSGVYLYSLLADGKTIKTRRMVLIK